MDVSFQNFISPSLLWAKHTFAMNNKKSMLVILFNLILIYHVTVFTTVRIMTTNAIRNIRSPMIFILKDLIFIMTVKAYFFICPRKQPITYWHVCIVACWTIPGRNRTMHEGKLFIIFLMTWKTKFGFRHNQMPDVITVMTFFALMLLIWFM